jgi:hypothetical protein
MKFVAVIGLSGILALSASASAAPLITRPHVTSKITNASTWAGPAHRLTKLPARSKPETLK